jgi:hypothetical protein
MYTESVQHNSHNTKAMLGIAQLHFSRGEKDQCQAQCNKILLADPLSEDASVLLSEVLFQKSESAPAKNSPSKKGDLDIPSLESVSAATSISPEDLENSIRPLRNYLILQPNNYSALDKVFY